MSFLIGPAGFDYPDWYGRVYPVAKKSKSFDPLAYLAEHFDLMEINSSYYGPPKPATVRAWCHRVAHNPRFEFTAKLYKGFTHERSKPWSSDDEKAVREAFDAFMAEGKLGAVLMQFPWSFKRQEDTTAWLARVVEAFKAYPLVLEVRHASWNEPNTYEWLSEHGVGICNIDQPLFRNSIKPAAWRTSGVGYVRLHGQNYQDWFRAAATRDQRYDFLYGEEKLKPWVERLKDLHEKVPKVFVVTNNHYGGQAVVDAALFQAMLLEESRVPAPLVEHYREALKPALAKPAKPKTPAQPKTTSEPAPATPWT